MPAELSGTPQSNPDDVFFLASCSQEADGQILLNYILRAVRLSYYAKVAGLLL